MLINKDSIFQKIPANLDQRQIFLLEGIRYCADSIFLGYRTLYNELEFISTNSFRDQSCALIFKEAWSQIDTTHRLTNLLSVLFSYNGDNKTKSGDNFKYLQKVKPLRNTFQHLDERIDELMLDLNAPVWGNISWLRVQSKTQVQTFVLSAGHPRKDFNSSIVNPAGQELKTQIDKITIEAIQKNANEKICKIDLSELYTRTVILIKKIETQMEEQINKHKEQGLLNENLPQDMLIRFDFEIENEPDSADF